MTSANLLARPWGALFFTEIWQISNGHWAASIDLGNHPLGWSPAGVGDFDHNGSVDILWREAATNHVAAWLLSNS